LPVARFPGKRNIQLRLAPPRNNQVAGINWASEFRIRGYNRASKRCGAIAQLGERLAGSQKVAGSSPAGSI
jgi:hypothetical protein